MRSFGLKGFVVRFLALILFTILAFDVQASDRPEHPVVLITGAFRGLGLGVGESLIAHGYRVVFAGRNTLDVPKRIAENPNALVVRLDLADDSSFQPAIETIIARWGRLDVVVHNAGIVVASASDQISMDELQKSAVTNFMGPVHLTQHVIKLFKAQRFGRIIYISSASSILRQPGLAMYTSTKMAAEGYFETLAGELRAQQDQYDVDVSVLRLSFVRGDYTPTVASHAGANVDPDLEAMMAWLRNHSPTSVQTVADSVQKVIEADNASPLTNIGIDGKTMGLYSLLPRSVQDTCSRFLSFSARFIARPEPGK